MARPGIMRRTSAVDVSIQAVVPESAVFCPAMARLGSIKSRPETKTVFANLIFMSYSPSIIAHVFNR
jgi:hypothetical protein